MSEVGEPLYLTHLKVLKRVSKGGGSFALVAFVEEGNGFFCSARSGFVLEGEQRRFNPEVEGSLWVSLWVSLVARSGSSPERIPEQQGWSLIWPPEIG